MEKQDLSAKPDVSADEASKKLEAAANKGPVVAAEVKVQMMEDGSVNITGPLDNPTLVYGMLESAKDAMRSYHAARAQANQPKMKIPNLMERVLARGKR